VPPPVADKRSPVVTRPAEVDPAPALFKRAADPEIAPPPVPRETAEPASVPAVFEREATEASREFRRLKALLLGSSVEGPRTLMICSSVHGEGTSTVTANLAIALAETTTGGVALVDANLVRPALHRLVGAEDGLGFSDLMLERAQLDQVVHETAYSNLWMVTAGKSLPFTSQMFDFTRLEEVLSALRRRFQFVLLDTAPISVFPEALVLAGLVDKVILVVEAERTAIDVVQGVKGEIERAGGKILGVALNRRRGHGRLNSVA
jgi:capsular exopolysaccharide synthesis family protein